MTMKTISLLTLFCLLIISLSAQTTYSWDSGATSGDWNVSGNWDNGTPGGNEELLINNDVQTSMTNNLSNTARWKLVLGSGCTQSRTISGSSENTFYDYGGNKPKIENYSSVNHTIGFPVKNGYSSGMEINPVNGDLTFTNTYNNNGYNTDIYGDNSKLLTFSGVISGSGNFYFKQYSKVKIAANSTVTGLFAIDAGELWFDENGAIGGGTIYVGNGGQPTTIAKLWLYDQDGGTICNEPIEINNASSSVYRVIGGLHTSNTNTFSGSVTLNGPLTIETQNSGATTDFSGVISGTNLVVTKGSGINKFSGENTFTGNLYVVSGTTEATNTTDPFDCSNVYLGETSGTDDATLRIGANSVTVDNPLEVRSGSSGTKTISYSPTSGSGTYSGSTTLNDGVSVDVATSGTLTHSGVVSGTGGLTKTGGGTLNLSNENTYTGATTVEEGTLHLDGSPDPLNGSIQVGHASGTFDASLELGTDGITIDEPVTIVSNVSGDNYIKYTPTSGTGEFSGGITLNDPVTIDVAAGGELIISDVISGSEGVTINGGTIILSKENIFTGTTTLQAGTLQVVTNDPFDCSSIQVGHTSGSDDAIFQIGANGVIVDSPVTIPLGSMGYKYLNYTPTSGTGEFSGAITLNDPATIDVSAGGELIISDVISGNEGLMKTGGGTLVLTEDNTFTGSTIVDGGTLELRGDIPGQVMVGPGATLKINGNNVILDGITVLGGGTVEIQPSKSLTITNLIDNQAGASGIIIKSDATGNGSLIQSNTSIQGTVERYIPAYTGANDGWHIISSSVSGDVTVSGTGFTPNANPNGNDLYYYNEASNLWMNYLQGTFDFAEGKGYLVARYANTTGSFAGTFLTTDKAYSNLSYTPGQGNGWHALGNPYPSSIEWDEDDNWSFSNMSEVAKVLQELSGNYVDIGVNETIPPTNGFFVQVNNSSNGFTIPANAQTHSTTNNYKTTQANLLTIHINNTANNYSDINKVGIRPDATMNFDWAFDSHKLFGWETAPQLWTVIGNEIYSTNYLAPLQTSYSLALNFHAGVNSTYLLNFEGVETFDQEIEIVLEDVQTNALAELAIQNTYSFEATTNDPNERFILHFNLLNGTGEVESENQLQILSFENRISILNQTGLTGQLAIFDTKGRIVYNRQITNQNSNVYTISLASGIYMVQAMTGPETSSRKIFIR